MTDSFSIFKLALDQFPCALITDEDGRYIYVNKGWCEYMGYSPENVYGKKVHSVAPDTKVDEALRSGKPILGYQIIGKNGQPLFNHCIPLKEQGKIIGTVVLTFFYNFQEAMDFSKTIASLSEKVNYYQEELRRLRGSRHSIDEIIGSSSAIQNLKKQIENAALTMSTVLIQGETGCGKELVANAIHDLSPRRDKPFIKINCSAIPPDLVESELFGYEGGAFTGASKSGKRGLFEAADTGSLFLDEIHQMAYFVQPKLLRVLQEKEVQHVGSSASIPIDTRIIAATNKPLEELVAQNQFREDLYYRLNVVTIKVPPLRERLEDIPELTNHLRQKLNRELGMHVEGITSEAEGRLMRYSWPGNVRELNNVLERAMNMQKTAFSHGIVLKIILKCGSNITGIPTRHWQTPEHRQKKTFCPPVWKKTNTTKRKQRRNWGFPAPCCIRSCINISFCKKRIWKDRSMINILIVDDDVYIGNMIEELLRQEGYSVTRAYSGTEALLTLAKKRPDLILLDRMLPGLDGEEVLPKMRGIPVIIVSARTDAAEKAEISMPEQPVVCIADASALARIFANILSNAVKYSDGDLVITLSKTGGLTFANHASGLDEISTGKLFDRFYTVENAAGSTGLGLSIARTLTEQMHGQLNARYTEGMLYLYLSFPG